MTGEQLEHSEWLDLLMELSGASKALESAIQHLEPDIKYMEEETYPAVLELERMEQNWALVQNNYTPEQKQALKKYGYAFLEPNQIPLIYSGRCKFVKIGGVYIFGQECRFSAPGQLAPFFTDNSHESFF